MNCHDGQPRLIELVYGELAQEERNSLDEHLTKCDACRRDFDALAGTRRMLSVVPQPQVAVDVPRLHAQAVKRDLRVRRRWQWTALAAACLAGIAVLVGAAHLRIEVNQDHLLLSWGREQRIDAPPPAPEAQPEPELPAQLVEHEARLAHLDELMRLVVLELDASGQRQRAWLTELTDRLDGLHTMSNARWNSTEHDVAALYQWAQYTASRPSEGDE